MIDLNNWDRETGRPADPADAMGLRVVTYQPGNGWVFAATPAALANEGVGRRDRALSTVGYRNCFIDDAAFEMPPTGEVIFARDEGTKLGAAFATREERDHWLAGDDWARWRMVAKGTLAGLSASRQLSQACAQRLCSWPEADFVKAMAGRVHPLTIGTFIFAPEGFDRERGVASPLGDIGVDGVHDRELAMLGRAEWIVRHGNPLGQVLKEYAQATLEARNRLRGWQVFRREFDRHFPDVEGVVFSGGHWRQAEDAANLLSAFEVDVRADVARSKASATS